MHIILPGPQLPRIAAMIQSRLQRLRINRWLELQKQMNQFISDSSWLQTLHRHLGKVIERNWTRAAARVAANVTKPVHQLRYTVSLIENATGHCSAEMPTMTELLAELRQTKEEFGNLHYNRNECILAVVTDPIELDGISLGEFETRLHIGAMAEPPGELSTPALSEPV